MGRAQARGEGTPGCKLAGRSAHSVLHTRRHGGCGAGEPTSGSPGTPRGRGRCPPTLPLSPLACFPVGETSTARASVGADQQPRLDRQAPLRTQTPLPGFESRRRRRHDKILRSKPSRQPGRAHRRAAYALDSEPSPAISPAAPTAPNHARSLALLCFRNKTVPERRQVTTRENADMPGKAAPEPKGTD